MSKLNKFTLQRARRLGPKRKRGTRKLSIEDLGFKWMRPFAVDINHAVAVGKGMALCGEEKSAWVNFGGSAQLCPDCLQLATALLKPSTFNVQPATL